MMGMNLHQR